MRVKAKFFAALREEMDDREIIVTLTEGATVQALLEQLILRHPQVGAHLDSLHFAVNRAYASAQTVLEDGDEVALLPPVGGG
jgi:molybdopterin converting factor subunit 1